MTPEFQTALDTFISGAQKKIDDDWTRRNFTHAMSPILKAFPGSRYVRIERLDRTKEGVASNAGSVYAFIDITGGTVAKIPSQPGDIYKAASFSAPAKNKRGSIFDPDNGINCATPYGIVYLR
jgi:hypothetical protein